MTIDRDALREYATHYASNNPMVIASDTLCELLDALNAAEKEAATERACRLANEAELHRADALVGEMRKERDEARAPERLREALTVADRALRWGHAEMRGRPPQHWLNAMTAVQDALAPPARIDG